jgi:tetratricopeptide (TPR) repeat protein
MLNLILIALLLSSGFAQNQANPKIKREDSIVVSAGIPIEQLQAEQDFREMFSKAQSLSQSGENQKALNLLDQSLDLVKKHAPFVRWSNMVFQTRARIHIAESNTEAAANDFRENAAFIKSRCESASCADDLREIGSHQLGLGDNSNALNTLLDALQQYQKAEDQNKNYPIELILQFRLHKAESELLAGVAYARLHNKDNSKTSMSNAIKLLESLKAESSGDQYIHSEATKTLEQARQIQMKIQSELK